MGRWVERFISDPGGGAIIGVKGQLLASFIQPAEKDNRSAYLVVDAQSEKLRVRPLEAETFFSKMERRILS